MLLYEYVCQESQTSFEKIRSTEQADSGLICLKCQSENVKRRISLFNATSVGRSIASNIECSGCADSSYSTCNPR
jgi:putative FmdB family regulatory protein